MRIASGFRVGRTKRRAVAALEAALVMPVVVLLLLGLWELGVAIQAFQVVSNAAREGARQAATGQYQNGTPLTAGQWPASGTVANAIVAYLQASNLPVTARGSSNLNVLIYVYDVTNGGSQTNQTTVLATSLGGAAKQLDQIQVTVQVPVSNFNWVAANFLPSGSYVTATAGMLCTVDQPVVVPTTIPSQPVGQ
jgi:Flp pilus assembly protein TadG